MVDAEGDALCNMLPRLPEDEEAHVAGLSDGPESRTEIQKWLVPKLQVNSPYSATYRYLHNTTVAINRLPAELLANILFLRHDLHTHKSSPSWTELMGICRHWRAIALSTAMLWTIITTRTTRTLSHLRVFLQRSGTALINLDFQGRFGSSLATGKCEDLVPDFRPGILEAVEMHGERIQVLKISLAGPQDMIGFQDVLSLISQKCSNLTTFRLFASTNSEFPPLDVSRFHALRSLICDVPIRCNPSVAFLSTLHVIDISANMPVLDLLQFLRNCVALHDLSLMFDFEFTGAPDIENDLAQTDPHGTSSKVLLPSLRNLTLDGVRYRPMADVLSKLSVSPRANVQITYDPPSFVRDPPLLETMPILLRACRDALSVAAGPGALNIVNTTTVVSCTITGQDKEAWSISLRFRRFEAEAGSVGDAIRSVARDFSRLQIMELEVGAICPCIWMDSIEWRAALAAVPYVQKLSVTLDTSSDQLWLTLGQPSPTSPVVVPDMKELHCQLMLPMQLCVVDTKIEATIPLMSDSLAFRDQNQARIRKLRFHAAVKSPTDFVRETNIRQILGSFVDVLDVRMWTRDGHRHV
ncbi:hypothetical protein OBBRIDRAFT_889606 [Obba rivulosa]|uniref:F-box domain-containing protein n=1 Tax=Obba rivulosa TaxID=1052685 RepID=A0A8E2DH32_9APHY|nr:hypothetical protein OBBRIDRAFT_889606 [Obba rivulosa]